MNDIIIIILLILLNGIFSMSEIALISARKSRLTADAKRGSNAAATALKLAEEPDRFLSTIQIGITLIGILTGLYSGAALSADLSQMLHSWGMKSGLAHNVAQISIVAIVTYLSIVVGELVPKRIGLTAADTVAKIVSRPMRILSVIAMPAVWLLSKSTAVIINMAGLRHKESSVTEEEIKSLIKDGTDAGEVRKVEQDIMERALVLGDRRVSSIMTPKIDVVALRMSMSADEIKRHIADELHDSYPVYCDKESKEICGVVSLKNLIFTIDSPDFSLSRVVHKATYFPETMTAYDALDHLKSKRIHCALVCDEFGDLAGVVTLSDILEGLIGSLNESPATPPVMPCDDPGTWIIDAQYPVYDFLSHFGLEYLYQPSTYSTVGGLILEELKHVPATGEKLIWNNITMEVTGMDGARISQIKVSFTPDGYCIPS